MNKLIGTTNSQKEFYPNTGSVKDKTEVFDKEQLAPALGETCPRKEREKVTPQSKASQEQDTIEDHNNHSMREEFSNLHLNLLADLKLIKPVDNVSHIRLIE